MNSDLTELLKRLDDGGVRFLIVGGYAVNHHTEPRYTKDIDLFISTDEENAKRLYRVLEDFKAPLSDVSVEDFQNKELFYQMGHEPNRVDILMSVPGIEFEAAWSNRDETEIRGIKISFLSLDDLIAAKRAAGRDRDLQDVKILEEKKKLFKRDNTPSRKTKRPRINQKKRIKKKGGRDFE